MRKIKPRVKIVLYSLICVFCIFMSIKFLTTALIKSNLSVSVNSGSNIDYKVHLKENSYYEKSVLDSDMKYIASLIDYIDTNINYKITSTDKMDYDLTYYIDATTRVYGDAAKTSALFEKKMTLLEEQKVNKKNVDSINIKENLKINYNEFNMLIASFKTSYDLNSTSDVSIVLHVKVHGRSGTIDKDLDFSDEAKLVIPLTEQTVDVEIYKKPADTYNVINNDKKNIFKNIKDILLALAFALIGIILLIKIMKLLNLAEKPKNAEYKKTLKKILRDYDLIIANVENSIDESKYEIVNISSFSELKDVHDNIGNPILFKENEKKNESTFVLVNENFMYKYVLSAEKEKTKDKENK